MNKFLNTIIPFMFLTVLAACSTQLYQANWQAKQIVADGIPNEWSLPLRFSDAKSGLQYNFTNDDANLYICIRATERPAQLKVLGSGVEIMLDPTGKNKETAKLHFPLPIQQNRATQAEDRQAGRNPENKPGGMNLEKQYQLEKPEISLSGFKPEYNGTFFANDAKGIKAAIDWDDKDNMTYEVVIPLNSFYEQDIRTLKDNPVIGVMINIAAMSRPQGSGSHEGAQGRGSGGQRQGGMGGREGGMGGGFGGGHGGGHGGGMDENRQSAGSAAYSSLSEPTSIKFKIKLSGLVKK